MKTGATVVLAALLGVGGLSLSFQFVVKPQIQAKIRSEIKDLVQSKHLPVRSVELDGLSARIQVLGANPNTLRKVQDNLSKVSYLQDLKIDTIPLNDPKLKLKWEHQVLDLSGVSSNTALNKEAVSLRDAGVMVNPSSQIQLSELVREEPVESALIDLMGILKTKGKETRSLKVHLEGQVLTAQGDFTTSDALLETYRTLRTYEGIGVVRTRFRLDAPSEQSRSLASLEPSNIPARESAKFLKTQATSEKEQLSGILSRVHLSFKFNSHELTPEAVAMLEELAPVLNAHKGMRFQIAGYTDNTGDEAYNRFLSQQRAEEVHKALVKLGVEAECTVKGFGASSFLTDNSTLVGRRLNRRVEIDVERIRT